MNHRQRFLETLLFGKPDKIPFAPGQPRESTLKVWRTQGLPEGMDYFEYLLKTLGIKENAGTRADEIDMNFEMMPKFAEKVIEHKDGHYIVQDWMGAITEISDEFDYTYIRSAKDFVTRKWHKFPVETRADWEEMKKRYNPHTPGRLPDNFKSLCSTLKNRDYPVGIRFAGPFWQLREWLGFENLCMKMIEEPEWVMEMADFWTDFVMQTMKPVLENVQLDFVGMDEDMAYKEHSMISPEMTRKFLVPAYKKWIKAIKASGCPIIDMDSDGHVGELIPIWIEVGINCNDPMEVAAGNDIVEYSRIYGKKMAYQGGIDKRAMAKGGKVMRDEVLRVVPPLLKNGGFIPGCDHGVPHDISWPNYVEYSRLLAELTGWL